MTAKGIYIRSLFLLGRIFESNDPVADSTDNLFIIEMINQILCDLKCDSITSITDTLDLPSAKIDALSYGLAMMLALTEGDGNKNKLFSELYNSKRSAALSKLGNIIDKLPKVTEG